MSYHAFVAMPFGTKEDIDFNKIYEDLIKPALEGERFEVFRADEEMRAGNIRTDMFQELLLADLVVADLSIDNPNVWYELGVRHGLRARGVIQIRCRREYMPFDVYSDRALKYHIKNGIPDPDYLEEDKKAIARMATETMNSWRGYKISPVYHLLPFLKEPEWKALRIEKASEFWQKQNNWERRIEIARKKQRPGDILVFADEAPTREFRLEAFRTAGQALRKLGQYKFALKQLEKALEIDPDDLECQQIKGLILERLEKYNEAEEWLEELVKKRPDVAENWALLGRVRKDIWVNVWKKEGISIQDMKYRAACNDHLLNDAIQPYFKGFSQDPSHYYSGINALTLMHLLKHLTGQDENPDNRTALEGGVRWAVRSALDREKIDEKNYWARVTMGDLEVLVNKTEVIEKTYKYAIAAADKDWFALDSSLQQLNLLGNLEFRTPEVNAAIKIFQQALENLTKPQERAEPKQILLFSGHMIDQKDREEPRFPANKESIASETISQKLDELNAGPDDLAMCGGACGGDLIFAKACLDRELKLEIRIPFSEPDFLKESVSFAGDKWRDLFFEVKKHPNTSLLIMPEELGPHSKKTNPYERNNLWQLYSALCHGAEKVRFVCLWNRKGGDGPGGTKHMHDTVLEYSGKVYVLDTNELW